MPDDETTPSDAPAPAPTSASTADLSGANNLSLGPEAAANHALALLANQEMSQPIHSEERFVPGLWFSFDPDAGVRATLESPKGQLGRITVASDRRPEWMGFQAALGAVDLGHRAILGFALRAAAPRAVTMRPCLRSGTEDAFVDCFFKKHVIAYGDESLHVDVIEVARTDLVPARAPWRDFVLFFQEDLTDMTLTDLRLFIL